MRNVIHSVAAVPVLLALAGAVAMAQIHPQQRVAVALGDSVGVPCSAGGSGASGWLSVRNTHSLTIPKGTRIKATYEHWDGFVINVIHHTETAEHVLAQDLVPGLSVQFNVASPMPDLGCKAQFDRGLPDLQVLDAAIVGGQVKLVVKNGSFGAAGASTARVRLMKCSQVQLGAVDVPVPGIAPGQTSVVLNAVTLPPGCQYLDATANANHAVQELTEANNSFTGVGVCIR